MGSFFSSTASATDDEGSSAVVALHSKASWDDQWKAHGNSLALIKLNKKHTPRSPFLPSVSNFLNPQIDFSASWCKLCRFIEPAFKEVLSNIRHRHLVSLIGFCGEQSDMILVYEYMVRGPLKNYLYGEIARYQPPTPQSGGTRGSIQEEERVSSGMSRVRRKDFQLFERVGGKRINVLQGLELHTGVFSDAEQKKIVDYLYQLQEMGRRGELSERTIQLGCCYNYATDKNGNPPGIIRDEEVDPIPPLLKSMIRRMVEWHVLPPTCIPNSCIVNVYDKDDCIPPHIDHHDFLRPFCTVSFLSECKILFGTEIKVLGPGEFSGSVAIPLPLGSVLILSGNRADVANIVYLLSLLKGFPLHSERWMTVSSHS